MQKQLDFEVYPREERGKNKARRLRDKGLVPAVLYGMGKDTVAVSIDAKEMTRVLKSAAGQNQILNLKVDGIEGAAAMATDWQVDPVKGTLLHVDLLRIDLSKTVEVHVPVFTEGVSLGVKEQGGIEDIVNREVEIECLPLNVPEKIVVDVSGLSIGDAIRVGDLPPPEHYSYLSDPDTLLVNVVAPRAELELEEEEAVVEGEEAAAGAEGEAGEKAKEEKEGEDEKGEPSEKGEKKE